MERTDELVRRMQQQIEREGLLSPGQRVLAAVSGGADSVALACGLRLTGRYDVHLAHVHHGLRQQASADADFVVKLGAAWELPVYVERIDTPTLAKKWGVGTEEAARRGRYQALVAVAEGIGAGAVAVAHHADDQVETILHRILRGTHLRGLSGMPVKRPLAGTVMLVRPLLWAHRRDIEAFCRRQGLAWRTDHTNALSDFTRNFIRNELLPLLRERINVRVDAALLRLSASAGEAETVLEEMGQELFVRARRKRSEREVQLRLSTLKKVPPLLASVALRAALVSIAAPQQELTQERFNDLLDVLRGTSLAADLPGGVRAHRQGQFLRLWRPGGDDAED